MIWLSVNRDFRMGTSSNQVTRKFHFWPPLTCGGITEAAAAQLMQLLMSLTNPDETSRMMAQPLAREPLEREYRNLAFLRSRFEYAKHLSISRAFLGAEAMERLGLPSGVLPWYPLATFPVTLARHAVSRALPGGRNRMTRRGRAAQGTHVRSLTMDRDAVIGESVAAG